MYAALIIDADADARFAIQNAFCDDPIEFRCEDSAQDGIESASSAKTDLILIRIELPSSSGFSVFSKLRRNAATKDVPVVLYASDVADDVFTRHAGLRTHAEGYLRLPIQQAELHSLIRPLLSLPEPQSAAPTQQLDVELHGPEQSPAADSPWDDDFSGADVDSALNVLNPDSQVGDQGVDFDFDDEPFEVDLSSEDALAQDELELTADDVPLDFSPIEEVALQSAAPPPAPALASPQHAQDSSETAQEQAPSRSLATEASAAPSIPPVKKHLASKAPRSSDAPTESPSPAVSIPPPATASSPVSEPATPSTSYPELSAPAASLSESAIPAAAENTVESPSLLSSSAESSKATTNVTSHQSQPAIDLRTPPAPQSAPCEPEPAANLHTVEPEPILSEPPQRESGSAGLAERRELLTLKSQLLSKDRELLALREELESLEQKFLEQRKERRVHQAQVAEFQASQLEAEESNLQAQEQIQALESRNARLQEEHGSMKHEVEQLKSHQAQSEQARQQLNEEVQSLKNEAHAQSSRLQDAEERCQSAHDERDGALSRVEELERQVSEHAASLATLQEELQERDTKIRHRDEQVQDAHKSLTELLGRLKAS